MCCTVQLAEKPSVMSERTTAAAVVRMLAATSLLLFLLPASGQSVDVADESGLFPDKPGDWQYDFRRADSARSVGLAPAATQAFLDKLDGIMAVLAASPVFHPPLGFVARASTEAGRTCNGEPWSNCSDGPAYGRLTIMFFYFVTGEGGRPSWGGEANASVHVEINNPRGEAGERFCLAAGHAALPDGRRFCGKPREFERIGGVPVYGAPAGSTADVNVGFERLILARPGLPLWVPVSRQEYLEGMLRVREAELSGLGNEIAGRTDPYAAWLADKPARLQRVEQSYQAMKRVDAAKAEEFRRLSEQMEAEGEIQLKSAPPVDDSNPLAALQASAATIRAELERMSPEDRASQAYWARPPDDDPLGSGLVPAGTHDAPPLVAVNPALLDQSRPPEEVQVISVTSSYDGSWLVDKRVYDFLRSVDWNRVATFIR